MSDAIARETFQTIQPDKLLEVHEEMRIATQTSLAGIRKLLEQSQPLFMFGLGLRNKAIGAGWDVPFAVAMRSGSDRLWLPTLELLKRGEQTVEKATTRSWLSVVGVDISDKIAKEVKSLVRHEADEDDVADRAEEEVRHRGYAAFAELSGGMVTYLTEEDLTMDISPYKEASWARVGTALAGLALTRRLEPTEEDPLEALYKL